jgi:hypothetical protein
VSFFITASAFVIYVALRAGRWLVDRRRRPALAPSAGDGALAS